MAGPLNASNPKRLFLRADACMTRVLAEVSYQCTVIELTPGVLEETMILIRAGDFSQGRGPKI